MKKEIKKVVIVGGGFGGFLLARKLESKKRFKVVLIDPKDYFLYIPLIHEVAVGQIPSESVKVCYKSVFKKVIHLKTRVKEINFLNKTLRINNDKIINYDILVVAIGSEPFNPIPTDDVLPTLKTIANALKIKKELGEIFEKRKPIISVVGEGPSGTEIITEIASLSKSIKKNITLNHFLYFPGYFLNLPKFNETIKNRMKRLNVNVHLNEPVKEILDNEIITEKGNYKSDYIIACTGVKHVRISTDINNDNGFLINSYCQIIGQQDAYAIGDVALLQYQGEYVPKLALIARQQAIYLSKHFINKEKDKTSKPIKFLFATFISLGKYYGIARIMNQVTLSGKIIWILKRSYYFLHILSLNRNYRLIKTLLISMISRNQFFFNKK